MSKWKLQTHRSSNAELPHFAKAAVRKAAPETSGQVFGKMRKERIPIACASLAALLFFNDAPTDLSVRRGHRPTCMLEAPPEDSWRASDAYLRWGLQPSGVHRSRPQNALPLFCRLLCAARVRQYVGREYMSLLGN